MAHDFERFFEVSIDMLCIAGTDGFFKRVNPAFERTLGWETEELLSRPFIEFVHPEDVDATVREVEKLATGIPTVSFENRYKCADGSYKHLVWTSFPEAESGLLYAIARDVTELKRAQDRIRLAIEASPSAMLMVDSGGAIVMANEAAERLLRYDRGELVGEGVESLVPLDIKEGHTDLREGFFREPAARPMGEGRDLLARRKDGSEIPVEIGLNPIRLESGVHVLGAIVDLTARKRAEAEILALAKQLEKANTRLSELASTDPLTGLLNRRAFKRELESHLLLAQRSGRPTSLLLADIDRFKEYNDRYGHPEGDEVLKAVAEVLLGTARRSDFVARYGGEEFAVGLPETDREGAVALCERFREAIEEHEWPERPITASFGAATVAFDRAGREKMAPVIDLLVGNADQALYQSKKAGRNMVTHWSELTGQG